MGIGTWRVIAFDRNNVPMLCQKNINREMAVRLADKWIERTDVSRVVGEEGHERRP